MNARCTKRMFYEHRTPVRMMTPSLTKAHDNAVVSVNVGRRWGTEAHDNVVVSVNVVDSPWYLRT
jgi:hypothetical protein